MHWASELAFVCLGCSQQLFDQLLVRDDRARPAGEVGQDLQALVPKRDFVSAPVQRRGSRIQGETLKAEHVWPFTLGA
jgi:hypothetical protein